MSNEATERVRRVLRNMRKAIDQAMDIANMDIGGALLDEKSSNCTCGDPLPQFRHNGVSAHHMSCPAWRVVVNEAVVTPETDCNGERTKSWMGTSTGRKFWPLDPRAEDVDVLDVARGLAMTCRYGGQIKRYYSVAEHCVLVSRFVPDYPLEALFHDSAEAYIGDMIRPLKHQPEMVKFREAETAIEKAIWSKLGFNITAKCHRAIKEIDDRILVDEISALSARPDYYLSTPLLKDKQPLGVEIEGWEPARAEREFLNRYHSLTNRPSTWKVWSNTEPARYNGSGTPCDMWTGPCCCGAWHKDGK